MAAQGMKKLLIIIIRSMHNSQLGQQPFYSVEMQTEAYPFGQLKETVTDDDVVLVHKKLIYHSERQLEILKKMAAFLGSLDSDYLIALHHWDHSNDGKFHFYYEYAPLTVEKWLLDLGDDVLEELELEMLGLATYLTQAGIRFRFEPRNLGLSRDIKVKYFLDEFAIDPERKLLNYKQAEEAIVRFFGDFRESEKEHPKSSTLIDRKSADSANLFGSSTTTRESWEVKSNKSSNSARAMMTKNSLKEKIENSKKKSLQILNKLKNLKMNP